MSGDDTAAPAGCRGVMFLPHMSAAGCPVVDGRSLGAFVGMSNFATAGDMVRAIIEGLDYQFLDIVEAMEAGLGIEAEKVVAVGGAVRNEFWMQNKADVVNRPIEVPEVEGAAILACIGGRLDRDEQDAFERVYKPGRTYEPDAGLAAKYADWYPIYKQLYPTLGEVSHQLFDKFLA